MTDKKNFQDYLDKVKDQSYKNELTEYEDISDDEDEFEEDFDEDDDEFEEDFEDEFDEHQEDFYEDEEDDDEF